MPKRLRRLSAHDLSLLLEAWALFWTARLAVIVLPFRWMRPVLGRTGAESPATVPDPILARARRIGWAVVRVSQLLPSSRGTCLAQAIAAQTMLRRRGIAATVYLGVARKDGEKLAAHAWVRSGEVILTGRPGHRRFNVLTSFAADRSN